MKRCARRTAPFAVLACLAASTAGGQPDASSSFGEYLEVPLVNVELLAIDKDGSPVVDLDAGEIQIFEDGREVEITHFRPPVGVPVAGTEVVGIWNGPGAAASSQPHADPLRLVVFVDNLNTGPASRARLLGQLQQVLDERLRPADEVMVVSFGGSLEIEMALSRSRKKLRNALERVAGVVGNRMLSSLRDRTALEDIQLDNDTNADGACVFVGQIARRHADNVNQRVQATLGALEQFIGSLAGISGRKVLLHVSDGIPLVPGAEAWDHATTLCDSVGASQGVPGATTPNQDDGTPNRFDPKTAFFNSQNYDTSRQWRRLAALASSHRVVIYPLFAPGLMAPTHAGADVVRSSARNRIVSAANKQDTLSILAHETGGEATFSTNDFRPAVQTAIDETLASYELAYLSPAGGDGEVHSIRVEVNRPGVRVRHRKSYEAKTAQQRVRDGVFSALLHGLQDNPLDARVKVVPTAEPIVDGQARVNLHVVLPFEHLTLLPKDGRHAGVFTVFVAMRDSSGNSSGIGQRTIPVHMAEGDEPTGGENFEYVVGLEVALEHNTIAVALRDDVGGTTSYLTAEIDLAG